MKHRHTVNVLHAGPQPRHCPTAHLKQELPRHGEPSPLAVHPGGRNVDRHRRRRRRPRRGNRLAARFAGGADGDRSISPSPSTGRSPPVPPAVVNRNESGRATVRAVPPRHSASHRRAAGRGLSTTPWPPISGFIQVEPRPGEPATDKSEVWITFDDTTVFVSIRCWQDPDKIAASDMRRDSFSQDDYFDVALDTFFDQRNASVFTIYASGGRFDAQITDERQMNVDWNPVWDLRTGRFEGGWTAEAAIPFRSLRYRPGRAQIWGVNLQRYTQWKNESSTLNRIPVALGEMGIMQMSLAGPLVGLEAPPASRNLEIKPYLVADMESDRLADSAEVSNEVNADLGIDIKYGLSQNLTADFTYNTDFAQVEERPAAGRPDAASASSFPEKRDFFLENQGTFGFGGRRAAEVLRRGWQTRRHPLLQPAHRSAERGRAVPIEGRCPADRPRRASYTLGLLEHPVGRRGDLRRHRATNFGVVRLKRDILRRSSVGVIYTRRSVDSGPAADATTRTASTERSPSSTTSRSTPTGPKRAPPDSRATTPATACRWTSTATATASSLESLRVGRPLQSRKSDSSAATDMRSSYGEFRFSPRPAGQQARAQVLVHRVDGLHRERRRPARDAGGRG